MFEPKNEYADKRTCKSNDFSLIIGLGLGLIIASLFFGLFVC